MKVNLEHMGHRILLKDLPNESPDLHAGVAVIEMKFDDRPDFLFGSYYPQFYGRLDVAAGKRR